MGEEKRKSTNERIAELKKRIIGCKDHKLTETLLNQLLSLHASTYEMNREIDVPISDVREVIDLGACVIKRTIKGYLFIARGGMYTFVEHRMSKVCTMLNTFFELYNKEEQSDEDKAIINQFINAVLLIFQAPIFASMSEESLFSIALSVMREFNRYLDDNYTNAQAPERTEEDYKADAEFEQHSEALELLANSPIPPEA